MLSRRFFLTIGCLAALASCSRPPEPEVAPVQPEETVTPPPQAKTPAFKITPIEPPLAKKYLHVYYQRESIPVAWVQEWLQGKDLTVVQRALPRWDQSKWPTDGDLYIVEPRSLEILQQLVSFASWPETAETETLNPIFMGYGFDPDNMISRPWRWTPYVFIQKKPKQGEQAVDFANTDWFARSDIAWPADEILLRALWKKRRGVSANLTLPAAESEAWQSVWNSLRASVRDEETCWKNIIQDESKGALLPASRRLQALADGANGTQEDGLLWQAPSCGTLLRIEYFMVRSGSERQQEAFDLAAALLSPLRQAELVRATGYLPVRSYLGHALDALPMKIFPEGWLDRSEFAHGGEAATDSSAEAKGEPAAGSVSQEGAPTPAETP